MPERVIGVDPLRQFLSRPRAGAGRRAELAWDPRQAGVVRCLRQRGSQARRVGALDGPRHDLEQDVRLVPQHAGAEKLRPRDGRLSHDDGGDDGGLRGLPRADAGARRMAAEKYRDSERAIRHSPKLTRDQMLDTCGTCHARRAELTGDFVPGDNFFDHYALTIPDESDLFYPDGQVRDGGLRVHLVSRQQDARGRSALRGLPRSAHAQEYRRGQRALHALPRRADAGRAPGGAGDRRSRRTAFTRRARPAAVRGLPHAGDDLHAAPPRGATTASPFPIRC